MLSTGLITIHWKIVNKTNHAIHWIVIYPVDSVIQPLNNPGQIYKLSHPASGTKLRVAKVKHDCLHIALPVNQTKLSHGGVHAMKDDGSTA